MQNFSQADARSNITTSMVGRSTSPRQCGIGLSNSIRTRRARICQQSEIKRPANECHAFLANYISKNKTCAPMALHEDHYSAYSLRAVGIPSIETQSTASLLCTKSAGGLLFGSSRSTSGILTWAWAKTSHLRQEQSVMWQSMYLRIQSSCSCVESSKSA